MARRLLIPFAVMQAVFTVFMVSAGEQGLTLENAVIYPQFTLWYLLSLVCWYVMLTGMDWLMRRRWLPFPSPFAFPVLLAVALGVGIGTIPDVGTRFSLCRTFTFFPFFVLGHALETRHLQRLQTLRARLLGGGLLALFALYIYLAMPVFVEDWLFGSTSYADLGTSALLGSATRLALYPVSLIGVLALLAVIPSRRLAVTSAGTRTLYIFLLHGLGVKVLSDSGLLDPWIAQGHYWLLPALAALTVATLGNAAVVSLARPLLELRRPSTAAATAGRPWRAAVTISVRTLALFARIHALFARIHALFARIPALFSKSRARSSSHARASSSTARQQSYSSYS